MKRKAGKGSIYRYRDGWRVQAPTQEDGTRPSLGTWPTRAEAARKLAAYEALSADLPRGVTVAAWGERFFTSRTARGVAKERSVWRSHVASYAIADRLLRRLTRQDVLAWVAELAQARARRATTFGRGATKRVEVVETDARISRQTRQHALRVLVSALEAAVDRGLIKANPARGVRIRDDGEAHEQTHEIVEGQEAGWTWLTLAEIDALLSVEASSAHAPTVEALARAKTIWTVAIYTGLRSGELWGLRWCDIRLEGAAPLLMVRRSYAGPTKTRHAVRDVPLLPIVVDALRRWRRESRGIGQALIFPSASGGCHAEGYDASLSTYLERAGITRPGITPRTWRHTYASHLIQGSWTARPLRIEEVRQVMGHSSIGVTQRYAHLAPQGIRDAFWGARSHTDRTRGTGGDDGTA